MPRAKKTGKKSNKTTTTDQTEVSEAVITTSDQDQTMFDKLQLDLQKNQSYLNLILGSLILIVVGVLLYNYFTQPTDNLGPSQQTSDQEMKQEEDVSKDKLPGKYTVKEGDTLFTIAQNYYNDGYQYTKLVETNKIADENNLEVGQVLDIPKIDTSKPDSGSFGDTLEVSPSPVPETMNLENEDLTQGIGGADNQTIWGEKIMPGTYTVQTGDWLSKIAGRTYGDVMAFDKIVKANNIPDPNNIEVGTILKIPN